jgi:hypothetical protein
MVRASLKAPGYSQSDPSQHFVLTPTDAASKGFSYEEIRVGRFPHGRGPEAFDERLHLYAGVDMTSD